MRILYKKRLKSEMFDKIEKLFGNLMQLAGYKKIHFMVITFFCNEAASSSALLP